MPQGSIVAGNADVEVEPLRVGRRSLIALFTSAGLSLLGFTMPSPMMPALRQQLELSASQVGLVSSSFAAGMFFAVMFFPAISDSWGRKPVMALALLGSAVGFLAQGIVISAQLGFGCFLLTRFATGLFAGCNPIFKAYLADVAPPSRLSQMMVYREAAATLAFVVGPSLGGVLATSSIGLAGPLYATAVAHCAGAFLIAANVEESIGIDRSTARSLPKQVEADGASSVKWVPVGAVFCMSFFYVISQSCFSSFFPILMFDRFGSSSRDIGIFTTKFSLLALAFQLFVYRPLYKRIGLERMGALGAVCIGIGLTGLSVSAVPFWLASVAYALGVASFPATIPTLLAGLVPASRRGLVLGLDSIVNNACRVFAPVLLGLMYARGTLLCFSLAGSMMSVVVLMLIFLHRYKIADVALVSKP